jgi:hypothetical protein
MNCVPAVETAGYVSYDIYTQYCHSEERGISARSSTKIGDLLYGVTCEDLLRLFAIARVSLRSK